MRLLPMLLVSCAIALVAASCSDDGADAERARGDDAPAGAQAELDAVVESIQPTLDALESSYEVASDDGDGEDEDAILDAFERGLGDVDGVSRVRRESDWSIDEPLRCGRGDEPSTGILAHGDDESYFVGRASGSYVAGFAEAADGDIGIVVARCTDGETGELLVTPFDVSGGDDIGRVSTLSFETSDSPEGRLVEDARGLAESPPKVEKLQEGWSWGDPIECGPSNRPLAIGSGETGDSFFVGLATRERIVVFAEHDGEDDGMLVGECEDGAADELRAIARPIAETRD